MSISDVYDCNVMFTERVQPLEYGRCRLLLGDYYLGRVNWEFKIMNSYRIIGILMNIKKPLDIPSEPQD